MSREPQVQAKDVSLPIGLSIIGGVLMITSGIGFLIMSAWWSQLPLFGGFMNVNTMMGGGGWRMFMPGALSSWMSIGSAVSIGLGSVTLTSSYMMHKEPEQLHKWSLVALISSIFGLFGMSGFALGPILGIIGGAIALSRSK